MKIPGLQLRTAYFSLLSGTITSNGSIVPVFDTVPPKQDYPFIVLSTQNETENTAKGCNGFDANILVDIVTGFEGGFGGKKQSDEIAQQIYNSVMNVRHTLALPDFWCVDTNLVNSNTLEEDNDSYYIVRRLINFRHILTEKE